jgi:Flp pilus assembly pilin Flp
LKLTRVCSHQNLSNQTRLEKHTIQHIFHFETTASKNLRLNLNPPVLVWFKVVNSLSWARMHFALSDAASGDVMVTRQQPLPISGVFFQPTQEETIPMKKVNFSRTPIRGQGMTEYIIIVALIAVAAIGVYNFFGKTVRNQTGAIAAALGGAETEAKKANTTGNKAGKDAVSDAGNTKGLENFTTSTGKK